MCGIMKLNWLINRIWQLIGNTELMRLKLAFNEILGFFFDEKNAS
jgi:hypothetical protein